jgi:hypothetical protein
MTVMPERHVGHVGRSILLGAIIGAVIGLLIGLIIHAIFSDGSLAPYEVVGGLVGLAYGALCGGFYGGALSIRRPP